MRNSINKILVGVVSSTVLLGAGLGCFYLWGLPALVSSNWAKNLAITETNKVLGANLEICNPKLSTNLNSDISFYVDKVRISKNSKELLNLEKFDASFSLKDILGKKLVVKKFYANNVYIDSYNLISLLPKTENKKQKEVKPCDFKIDIYNALIGVKYSLITYNSPELGVRFAAKNIMLDRTKSDNGKKYLHFDFNLGVKNSEQEIKISANDDNRIYTKPNELIVNNFPINIEKSKVLIDIYANKKTGMNIDISAKDFNARDIYNIAVSNIIIPNGKELFAPIVDINGSANLNLHLSKNKIDGKISVNETDFKILYLENLPVKITKGTVLIDNKNITLKDFDGYYANNKNDTLNLEGYIKDYWKTCDTKVTSDIFIHNDVFENYLSKLIDLPIGLVGEAGSKLIITSKNGSCDLVWYFILDKGEGFKFGNESIVLNDYTTMFKADFSVVKNIFKINTIDYYIADKLAKNMDPLLAISGNIDMAQNMKVLDLDLNIPKPLPSEFLNFLTCQKIFKGGEVYGKLKIDNYGKYPKMDGALTLEKVRIPSQRLFIKLAKFGGRGDKLGAIASGRFKKSKFDFNGYIVNEIKLPIIVKSVNLTVDKVDVDRILTTNASQTATTPEEVVVQNSKVDENDADVPTFTKELVIIEKCALNLISGKYKEINFGNIKANLTLDKDGILNIWSNRFDIADGISTLKVKADLIKKKYYFALGVKNVDSNIMATAILGLPREIAGKAMGGIILESDENLKLNGHIYFDITDEIGRAHV